MRVKAFFKTPEFYDTHAHLPLFLGTCTTDDRRFILFGRQAHDILRQELERILEDQPLPPLIPQFEYIDIETHRIPDREAYIATTKVLARHNQFYKEQQRRIHYEQLLASARALRQAKSHRFVAVDVESWERDHTRVLELGWSVYDSINERYIDEHRAVLEYSHLKNGTYVPNRRDNFLFGTTKWTTLQEATRDLQLDLDRGFPEQPLVLLGHAIKEDLKYLASVGVHVPGAAVIYDTGDLYLNPDGSKQKPALSKLLAELKIQAFCLHNAGNDAHYTMEAFLKLTDAQESVNAMEKGND